MSVSFSVCFKSPSGGTRLYREWASTETPPYTITVEFHPDDQTIRLHGRPTNLFVDPNPPAGTTLVAELETPRQSGESAKYTLEVNADGEPTIPVQCDLRWQT